MVEKENDVVKKTLKHYIELELYSNGVADDVDLLVKDLLEKCNDAILDNDYYNTKIDYNKVDKVINEYLNDFETELNDRLEEEAEIIKNNESDFLKAIYGSAIAVGAVSLAKILFSTIDNKDTVKEFAKRSADNIRRTYETALRSGYLFGKDSSEIKTQADQNIKQVFRGIRNGVTTAIPAFAKTTDKIIFLNNNIEVVWCSTLDGSTCLTCASLSGTRYKLVTSAPPTPLHNLCRCILIPANIITEPIPNFEEFVKSLTDEEQEEVLGKNRFNLWKEYDIPLNKFLNDGRVKPLKELNKELKIKTVTNKTTAKLVSKKYPNDVFVKRKITDNANLYIAEERIKAGIKDPVVYESDKMMATTLIKETGKDVYLLTEKGGLGIKNPDGFYTVDTIEMKHVTGSLRKVGVNAVRALKQSDNVFIYVDNNYSIEACLERIKGAIKNTRQQFGSEFIEPSPKGLLYIYTQEKLFERNWSDIL